MRVLSSSLSLYWSFLCRRLAADAPVGDPLAGRPSAGPHAADRRRRDGAHPALHHRARIQLAAHRLPAGLDERAGAAGRARRRRRGAGLPALLRRRASLLPSARRGEPQSARGHDRHQRGGPRTDRGGGLLRGEPRPVGREPGASRPARRPAQDRARRRPRCRASSPRASPSTTSPAPSTHPRPARPRR